MLNPALPAVALMILFTMVRTQRVRLVGGPSPREGRLEVSYSGSWGTVCDDSFTNAAAGVVCYMLGYGGIGQVIGNRYGEGSGTIWLDDVRCSGTETSISDCQHNDWGVHDCDHGEDVSVLCRPVILRLVGGPSPREGRLEVYYNSTWGTVCDDGFTDAAAGVVCSMLGYGRIGRFIGNSYGAGNGTIWLGDADCSGTEINIADCQHHDWGSHNCSHSEDVSVSCPGVRLVEGPNLQEGRLEVFHDGIWGTVCGDYFNDAAARVVCHMLGYGHFGHFLSHSYGAGSGQIWLDDVRCNGTETIIADCQHNDWGVHDCHHGEDVSVSCITVRLVGGSSPQQGRLEVRYKGTWGTVCDDHFDNSAARVVCHMLGYKHTGQFTGNRYGAGNGTIWLDDIRCDGTETHISECSHGRWSVHNCEHNEDVSVSCVGDSSASTTRTSYPDMTSLSPTSSTRSTSSPSSTVTSTSSTQSDRIDDGRYTAQIAIAVVVVVGLVICVIVVGLVVHFHRHPRRERPDAAMIQMPVTASTESYRNDAFDDTARYDNPPNYRQASDNNANGAFQQPSAPVAGAVGGVGPGDIDYEETAMYESLSDDKGQP